MQTQTGTQSALVPLQLKSKNAKKAFDFIY